MTAQQSAAQNQHTGKAAEGGEQANVYVDFLFFQVDPAYRRLLHEEKERGVGEFRACLEKAQSRLKIRTYLTLGLRHDCDFLVWTIGSDLTETQRLVGDLYRTGLGRFLSLAHSFVAMKKASIYSRNHPQAFEQDLPPLKYCFVYPFVKSREWYLLSRDARQGMMTEHTRVGKRYPQVRLNTTYAFGLGDQDFVLAFECDEPADFESLVQDLRETEASRYTVRDLPMIPCVIKSIDEMLDGLALY